MEGATWRVDSYRGGFLRAPSLMEVPCAWGCVLFAWGSTLGFLSAWGRRSSLHGRVSSAWGVLSGGGSLQGDFSAGGLVLSAWRGPLWGFYLQEEFSAGGRGPLCSEVSFLRPLCRSSPWGSPLWHLMPGSPRAAFVSRALTRVFPSLASEASGDEVSRLPWLALGLRRRPVSALGRAALTLRG